MRLPVCVFVSVATVAALSAPAFAKTVKVDPDPGNNPIAAAVAQLEDGDKLILNAGTYDERLTLVDLNKIKVICKGDVIFDGVGPSATVAVTNCTKIKMSGFMILNAPSQGLLINGCDNVSFKKSEIVDHATQGIQINASTKVSIIDNLVEGGSNGIQVTGDSVVKVLKNTVTGSGAQSIFQLVSALPGSVISRNLVQDSGNAGISFDGIGNKVEKNDVQNCLFGIVTTFNGGDMSGSSMQKNRISGGAVALRAYAPGTLLIAKNTVVGASSSGLQIAKGVGGLTVTKNKISDTPNGIDDESDGGATISKNKVENSTNFGFRARGAGGSTFEKNTVNDTVGDGFTIWTAGNTFTKNKASGNQGLDLESARVAEGDTTFVNNKFGTTTFDAP